MVKEAELEVRNMDDEKISVAEVSRKTAELFKINQKRIEKYLLAKRNGYNSAYEHKIYYEQKRFEKGILFIPTEKMKKRRVFNRESEKSEMCEKLYSLLKNLSPIEKEVIEERFFSNKTLREIGRLTGYTFEGIRRIELRALEKMRVEAKRQKLEDYLLLK